MITVAPLPHMLPKNPYLDLLYGAMEHDEVVVWRERPRVALPKLFWASGQRVLHLHFFDGIIQHRGVMRCGLASIAFLGMLAGLRARGVALVWTAHNAMPHECYHSSWALTVYRHVVQWSDAIIVHSAAARNMLTSIYGGVATKSMVIPHGHYIGHYGEMREQVASRQALGLPVNGRIFAHLGMLRPYKNLEYLIDAFGTMVRTHPSTLLIAGSPESDEYAAHLQKRAAAIPHIVLHTHFIPDDELASYLAAADVLVFPYQRVLTSGGLLLALSYGRGVVAPSVGPVRELIREGREGFLFQVGENDSLRTALIRAWHGTSEGTMQQTALERARAFDWERIAARTVHCYQHVCAGR